MPQFHGFVQRYIWIFILILVLSGCKPAAATDSAASSNSPRADSQGVYIQNKGSDTIVNLALAWAERYQQVHPNVRISVTGGGTGTGIASLINGTLDIANASRAIKKEEIAEAEKNGIEPLEHVVARDAIAVIVNPSNPVQKLSLEQISGIYRGEINNWKELGGEDRPIVRVSRETNSGTHVYFLESVIRMGKKDSKAIFSEDTLLLPSSEGIISEVGDNPNAIGYDGLGYVTPHVKVIAIAKKLDGSYVLPSAATVNDGTYPISRDLYMYTGKQPNAAIQAYLTWILSPEGQEMVTEQGFVPVKK
jgi:phosphate transport system substrate-binding protein